MKGFEFWIQFHWNLFRRVPLTIIQHWFRQWLGAVQATSHYLNQWWAMLATHMCVTRPQWVNAEHRLRGNFWHTFRVYIKLGKKDEPGRFKLLEYTLIAFGHDIEFLILGKADLSSWRKKVLWIVWRKFHIRPWPPIFSVQYSHWLWLYI